MLILVPWLAPYGFTRPKSGNAAMARFATEHPYADREAAARQLVQLAAGIEPVQDGRIHIEKISAPFLYGPKGNGSELGAGISTLFNKVARASRKRHLCAPACAEQESPELGTSASAGDGRTLQTSIAISISSSKNFVRCLMAIIHPE